MGSVQFYTQSKLGDRVSRVAHLVGSFMLDGEPNSNQDFEVPGCLYSFINEPTIKPSLA